MDYYPQDDADTGGMPEGADSEEQNQQPEGETALLPKSIFGDRELQPGEQVTFKVVREHEDEVEVQMVSGGDEQSGSEMDRAQTKLASMAGAE